MGVALDGVAPGPGGLTRPSAHPAQALGGLAAFFAQPADEVAATFTLAEFLTQPGDDDQWWGAPTSPTGDSDNYLGEFWIRELADEVGRRSEIAAPVVALVLGDGRVVAVPR